MECGIVLEGYADIKEEDVLEFYETKQVEQTLDSTRARLRLHCRGRASLRRRHDLKAKRKLVKSLKDQLRARFGAAVAETEGHDKWQRSVIVCALVGDRMWGIARTGSSASSTAASRTG